MCAEFKIGEPLVVNHVLLCDAHWPHCVAIAIRRFLRLDDVLSVLCEVKFQFLFFLVVLLLVVIAIGNFTCNIEADVNSAQRDLDMHATIDFRHFFEEFPYF